MYTVYECIPFNLIIIWREFFHPYVFDLVLHLVQFFQMVVIGLSNNIHLCLPYKNKLDQHILSKYRFNASLILDLWSMALKCVFSLEIQIFL